MTSHSKYPINLFPYPYLLQIIESKIAHTPLISRQIKKHNRLFPRQARTTRIPSQLLNSLLQNPLVVAPKVQPTVPLPTSRRPTTLHDLPHLILLPIFVCGPKPLHQLGHGGVHGHMACVDFQVPWRHLPWRVWSRALEEVDLGVFFREEVVVAWVEADGAGGVDEAGCG